MAIHSFRDCNGKQGKAGDTVMLCQNGETYGDVLIVTKITNKGIQGTQLTLDNGQQCFRKSIQLVDAEPTFVLPSEINGWQIYRSTTSHNIIAYHPCGSDPVSLTFENNEVFQKWYEDEKKLCL